MLETILLAATVVSLLGWLHLCSARGGFWRADQRLHEASAAPPWWPHVSAVVPARDEAESIGPAVRSLLAQDYPGGFGIVVVVDGSSDDTAGVATRAAGGDPRLCLVAGGSLPAYWTGKLWAVHQGVQAALERWPQSDFLLLTDADIVHSADNLRRLVAKAESEGRDLVSLMVRLRCRGLWERLLVPPFIFFFQKLYPFPWVNDDARPEAAAAGGCMLVRTQALHAVGGVAAVRDRLIDDCALAARIKQRGSIWLGLGEETRSIRSYPALGDLWTMVARTAFTQLGHSPLNLAATVVGMIVLYTAPPVAVAHGLWQESATTLLLGAIAWAMMAMAFAPTLALYRLSVVWSAALPVAAILYVMMTVDSARLTWQGRGNFWKGRNYDNAKGRGFETGVGGDLGREPPW